MSFLFIKPEFIVTIQEDVKLMVDTNLDAFRFSISWSRLIPSKSSLIFSFTH